MEKILYINKKVNDARLVCIYIGEFGVNDIAEFSTIYKGRREIETIELTTELFDSGSVKIFNEYFQLSCFFK